MRWFCTYRCTKYQSAKELLHQNSAPISWLVSQVWAPHVKGLDLGSSRRYAERKLMSLTTAYLASLRGCSCC
eukprot:1156865-Pelagomonas_calceolata.AAC.3